MVTIKLLPRTWSQITRSLSMITDNHAAPNSHLQGCCRNDTSITSFIGEEWGSCAIWAEGGPRGGSISRALKNVTEGPLRCNAVETLGTCTFDVEGFVFVAMEPSDGPSGRTLCEINCQLVTANAGPTLGRLGGHACPDIYLTSGAQTDFLEGSVPTVLVKVPPGRLPRGKLRGSSWQESEGVLKYVLRHLLSPLPGVRSRLQAATRLQLLPAAPADPLAWHLRKPLLAAADRADRIHIYNFAGRVPSLGLPPAGDGAPAPLSPAQLLYHEFQRGVAALAWRPNSGACLAAACARGVCIWRLAGSGGGGGARTEGVGGASRVGTGGGGGAWMTWLRPPAGAGALSCLAWHPRGHLLAAASQQGSGFFVWDVATGACTPLRAGTEPVSWLSWSPCGSYLLAGHPSGSFRVWQTHSWWSLKWSAAEGGSGGRGTAQAAGGLAGACWSPDSRTLVLAYVAAPQQLVSLHFTADPPSLQAQLLPLMLPEITGRANGTRGTAGGGAEVIESVAWDPRGQRLAVAVGGTHPAAGCVALYDTRCEPLLSARFIGFMRVVPMAAAAAAAGAQGQGASARGGAGHSEIEEEQGSEGAEEVAEAEAAGPAVRLCFQPGFGQGALLAVRRGDFIGTVPLYFSS